MESQVVLRPVTEDDLPWLENARNDPAAAGPHEWHGWQQAGLLRRRWAESGLLGDTGGVMMVVHGTDRAGTISWRQVRTGQVSYCWALGIWIAPEFRQRGYGTQAQWMLVRYLFAHTQVNRVEATTEITNIGEQRALEAAGFSREGVQRGATFRLGRWHDQVIYSVLRDEAELEPGSVDGW